MRKLWTVDSADIFDVVRQVVVASVENGIVIEDERFSLINKVGAVEHPSKASARRFMQIKNSKAE